MNRLIVMCIALMCLSGCLWVPHTWVGVGLEAAKFIPLELPQTEPVDRDKDRDR